MSSHIPPPPCKQLCTRSYSNKHTHTPLSSYLCTRSCSNKHTLPRPGWAPDPLLVGIRSPDGLVVGSCTSHPGVLGSIPKREEPGKTGAPCVKVPGSSQSLTGPSVMGSLVHTGLGSSSLVAHVLPYPPPPHANSFVLGPPVINTHTHEPRTALVHTLQ
jgi:hypothetical protein